MPPKTLLQPGKLNEASAAGAVDLLGASGGGQKSVIVQVGIPNEEIGLVVGFGKELPFSVSLKQLVPEGWRVFTTSDKVKAAGNVTWSGLRRPWISVLNNLLADNGMVGTLDWSKREITIRTDPAWEGKAKARDQAAGPEPVLAGAFELRSGKTLRENMQMWVEAAQWTLSWEKDDLDYPGPKAGVILTGTLIGDNGVIKSVIDKYHKARRPLEVTFYTQNRVVRVTEGKVLLPGQTPAAQ